MCVCVWGGGGDSITLLLGIFSSGADIYFLLAQVRMGLPCSKMR